MQQFKVAERWVGRNINSSKKPSYKRPQPFLALRLKEREDSGDFGQILPVQNWKASEVQTSFRENVIPIFIYMFPHSSSSHA